MDKQEQTYEDQMQVPLIPPVFKAVMKTSVKVGFFCEITFFVLVVSMGIAGMFKDIFSALFFSVGFLLVIPLALIPCLRHYKTSQSSVEILQDRMRVLDKRGVCWREIYFDAVTNIGVENISGFFYGQDRHQAKHTYICVFLHGCTKIPDVAYSDLFTRKDFFALYYTEDALDLLSRNYQLYLSQTELQEGEVVVL